MATIIRYGVIATRNQLKRMNNMKKSSKWSKYKNKATGDIVEARPNTKFPEYQLLRWDDGVFGGVKTCTSMLVTEFNWEIE